MSGRGPRGGKRGGVRDVNKPGAELFAWAVGSGGGAGGHRYFS